jgi:phosphatidylglycerophosphate synthase
MTPNIQGPDAAPSVPKEFTAALAALRSSQKSSRGAPAYSRFVNRPVGRVFAASAYVIGMAPNQVTAVSATLTLSGIALIAILPPTLGTAVLIALLLVVGYAMDAADGQLARLRGGGSLVGEWLDHVVDAVKSSTLHAAVLVAWFRFFDVDPVVLLVPLGYQAVTAVFFFAMILTDLLRRIHRGTAGMIVKKTGPTSPLYALAVMPADYGFLCLLFLLWWWQPVFLVLYSVLFALNAIILAASLVRWFRELSRLR